MQENLHRIAPQLESRARRLRKGSTFPERLLWSRLRASRLSGFKFRRQTAIDKFIADFYCPAAKLIIELDGVSHDGRLQRDETRTARRNSLGYEVVRYTKDEILEDVDAVAEYIAKRVNELITQRNSSPSQGESGRG